MAGFDNGALVLDHFDYTTAGAVNNNVEISGSLVYVTVTTNLDEITGLVPQTNTGILLLLVNIGPTNSFVIKHDSGSSDAPNRIFTHDQEDLIVPPGQTALLGYDSNIGFWAVIKIANALEGENVSDPGQFNTPDPDNAFKLLTPQGYVYLQRLVYP